MEWIYLIVFYPPDLVAMVLFIQKNGKIIITNNTKYRNDHTRVEDDCECYTCKNYTKAYIAHLFHGKEMLAGTLSSIHNLYFIVNLVKKFANLY